MISNVRDLVQGASYLPRGLALALKPGTRRYVFVPAGVNTVLFAGVIFLLGAQLDSWLERLLPDWLNWLEWLLWPLFVIAMLAMTWYAFTLVANLIASPFNDRLAEKVAADLGRTMPQRDGSLVGDVGDAVLGELRKWRYFGGLALLVLLVWFIPVLNILFPLLWLLFGVWMMAVEYLDYPTANAGLGSFPERRDWVRRHRWLGLGFGGAVLAATLVPVLNFLVMPVAVAGATALWADHSE